MHIRYPSPKQQFFHSSSCVVHSGVWPNTNTSIAIKEMHKLLPSVETFHAGLFRLGTRRLRGGRGGGISTTVTHGRRGEDVDGTPGSCTGRRWPCRRSRYGRPECWRACRPTGPPGERPVHMHVRNQDKFARPGCINTTIEEQVSRVEANAEE